RNASRSIVLCTHDLDEAERLADTVAILRRGRVVACDASEALRAAAAETTLVRVTLAAPCPAAGGIASSVDGATQPRLHQAGRGAGSLLPSRTARPSRTNPAVVAALVAAGAAIVSVTSTVATLEDVYATALGPEAGSAAGRGR